MASLVIPRFVIAKTEVELQEAIAIIQAKVGAKLAIISINYKPDKKQWVLWYQVPLGLSYFSGI